MNFGRDGEGENEEEFIGPVELAVVGLELGVDMMPNCYWKEERNQGKRRERSRDHLGSCS